MNDRVTVRGFKVCLDCGLRFSLNFENEMQGRCPLCGSQNTKTQRPIVLTAPPVPMDRRMEGKRYEC